MHTSVPPATSGDVGTRPSRIPAHACFHPEHFQFRPRGHPLADRRRRRRLRTLSGIHPDEAESLARKFAVPTNDSQNIWPNANLRLNFDQNAVLCKSRQRLSLSFSTTMRTINGAPHEHYLELSVPTGTLRFMMTSHCLPGWVRPPRSAVTNTGQLLLRVAAKTGSPQALGSWVCLAWLGGEDGASTRGPLRVGPPTAEAARTSLIISIAWLTVPGLRHQHGGQPTRSRRPTGSVPKSGPPGPGACTPAAMPTA